MVMAEGEMEERARRELLEQAAWRGGRGDELRYPTLRILPREVIDAYREYLLEPVEVPRQKLKSTK